ncbi:phospho-sugar mutase [Janibacter terrae]|uniref:Phospho-sugar mutase n=1 Tax=Janibacter terrae TaxID=103817 RepID=A0ABZ2FBY9_9MICO|nr:phospho-sugar mutase [Janibacter terrae]MBA4083466.1 phospho-sugar mutase [Kytococcus sp.]
MSEYSGRHSATELPDDLLVAAAEWAADDPDPVTRAELQDLVTAAEGGDAVAVADLTGRFAGLLQFGTAGLRGALGAGPHRMNRSVVIRAAAGLVAHLKTLGDGAFVVVGRDARHNSDAFAIDTAAVVVAAGGRAAVLPQPLPTPVLAFAIRHLGADAGVMVTASHNPPQDNGYKVYLGDGRQIVPPSDAQIAAQIDRVASVADVPRAEGGWEVLGDEVLEAYLDAIAGVVAPDTPRDLRVLHTALHGVGDGTVQAAFTRAGFAAPQQVPSQAAPDPDFPTVAFPNPEEDGALDAALAAARESGPDLVIANDPDADRCAVAVPDAGVDGGWRLLRGDELGVLLASHLIVRGVPEGRRMASSIVSSRLLAAMCRQSGVAHEETLTGFKWIARVEDLHYGYEEALGYCVAPDLVRDKDGVSAALLVAELAAILKAEGRTLQSVLDDLHTQLGVHATDAFSIRVTDLADIVVLMARLRRTPPTEVAGSPVTSSEDLALGDGRLPPTEGLRYLLEDGSRIIVRPSGTEPKLKVYLEAIEPVAAPEDLGAARERAAERLGRVRAAMEGLTAL